MGHVHISEVISSYESEHKACADSWQTKSQHGGKRRTGHHTLEEEILTMGHLPVEDHTSKNILAVQTVLDGDERERERERDRERERERERKKVG